MDKLLKLYEKCNENAFLFSRKTAASSQPILKEACHGLSNTDVQSQSKTHRMD